MIALVVFFFLAGLWSQVGCAPLNSCPWGKCSGAGCQTDKKVRKATLTFVGAWDDEESWREVIAAFKVAELANRGVDVNVVYEQLDKYNYEDVLLTDMINRQSPNLFMMLNTWLPKYAQRIVAMPEGIMTMDEFEKYFPRVAQEDLVAEGKIYSLPLYVDTLALFYNKDMFYNAGYIQPPATWSEFTDYVTKLTIKGEGGKLERLGAAVGGAEKVDRSQDILMLLVMQNNLKSNKNPSGNLVSFQTPEAVRAVTYYTDFADPRKKAYTWDYAQQMYSIDAFTAEKAAMSINYSYQIANIQEKTSGALNYGVAPVPQQYPNDKINYAYYWTPVVAKDADCTREEGMTVSCETMAWDFISFIAQEENAALYLEKTNRPAANLLLAEKQAGVVGSKLAPFAQQVLTARSWKNIDNGKNDETLQDMIDSIVTPEARFKVELEDAMEEARNVIKELN